MVGLSPITRQSLTSNAHENTIAQRLSLMEYLTPAEVSQSLNLPASTLRRWSAIFESQLSRKYAPGQKRKYTLGDLNLFRKVQELSAEGHTIAKIKSLVGVVDQQESANDKALMIPPQVARALELTDIRILQLQQQLADQQTKIDYLLTPWWKRKRKNK
jgi:DNA-binding transcriptional MerR regulator